MAGTGQSSAIALFGLLREHPLTTRTELVHRSGLSKATVSEAIGFLLAQGFLTEVGKRQPGRGRSQIVLEFDARRRLVLGAQFTEHGCHAVLGDLRVAPIAATSRPLNGSDPAQFVAALADCVDERVVRSQWRIAFRRLRARPGAFVGGIIVLLFVVTALAAPVLAPHGPNRLARDHHGPSGRGSRFPG